MVVSGLGVGLGDAGGDTARVRSAALVRVVRPLLACVMCCLCCTLLSRIDRAMLIHRSGPDRRRQILFRLGSVSPSSLPSLFFLGVDVPFGGPRKKKAGSAIVRFGRRSSRAEDPCMSSVSSITWRSSGVYSLSDS